jgi:hypothetical protein
MIHGERSPLADKAGRIMWITTYKQKTLAVFQPGFSIYKHLLITPINS